MIIGHRSSSRSISPYHRYYPSTIIKDLRSLNLLDEFFPLKPNETRVQETVEVQPCPQSCERIFYSYIDDRTDTRRRTLVRLDRGIYVKTHERSTIDFYSTTLFIFPQQRYEKFISEIRYAPEHITIKYRTNLEVVTRNSSSSISDVFYRI